MAIIGQLRERAMTRSPPLRKGSLPARRTRRAKRRGRAAWCLLQRRIPRNYLNLVWPESAAFSPHPCTAMSILLFFINTPRPLHPPTCAESPPPIPQEIMFRLHLVYHPGECFRPLLRISIRPGEENTMTNQSCKRPAPPTIKMARRTILMRRDQIWCDVQS